MCCYCMAKQLNLLFPTKYLSAVLIFTNMFLIVIPFFRISSLCLADQWLFLLLLFIFAPIVNNWMYECSTVWYIMEMLQIIAKHLKTYECQWQLYQIRRGFFNIQFSTNIYFYEIYRFAPKFCKISEHMNVKYIDVCRKHVVIHYNTLACECEWPY
jgi:hypothetical protein